MNTVLLCCVVRLQESPRWQVVLRALAALEAVLQRGSSQACGEVAVMFQSDPSHVRNALNNPQVGVRVCVCVGGGGCPSEATLVGMCVGMGVCGCSASILKCSMSPVASMLVHKGR
jgi:hypothetical protein